MLKLLPRLVPSNQCRAVTGLVSQSIVCRHFCALKKPTRDRNYSFNLESKSSTDSSKLPDADRFGYLSEQVDSNHSVLHSSLKARTASYGKVTDELLHEPLEDPLRELGLLRNREHPRYLRNSQRLAKYCKEGNVEAALSQFFDTMLTTDRVMPSRFDAHTLLDALASTGRSADAFKVYEKMKEVGIKPTQATYSRLFRACAEDASVWFRENEHIFRVCNDGQLPVLRQRKNIMLQRALSIEHVLEQFGGPGLKRAQILNQQLRHKGIQPIQLTYNTLLLALARGGDLQGCLATLDSMLKAADHSSPKNPIKVDGFTVSSVLSGIKPAVAKHQLATSVQQTQSSQLNLFQLMLSLWHKLVSHCNVDLSTHIFVLFAGALKCLPQGSDSPITLRIEASGWTDPSVAASFTSSSGIADLKAVEPKLLQPMEQQVTVPTSHDADHELQHLENAVMGKVIQLDWEDTSFSLRSPVNLINPATDLIQVVPPYGGWLPWQRLALFGGLQGFLNSVEVLGKTKPEIRLLTELIGLLPPAKYSSTENELDQWERALLDAADKYRISLDMPFYNSLINRRAVVGVSVECLLAEVARSGLLPDQVTWGSLARTCKSVDSVKQLLKSLAAASSHTASTNTRTTLRPSLAFFTSLLGANRFNWALKAYILQLMMGEEDAKDIKVPSVVFVPDRRMVASLEIEVALFRRLLSKGAIPEDGSPVAASSDTDGVSIPPFAATAFRRFLTVYNRWLRHSYQEEPSIR